MRQSGMVLHERIWTAFLVMVIVATLATNEGCGPEGHGRGRGPHHPPHGTATPTPTTTSTDPSSASTTTTEVYGPLLVTITQATTVTVCGYVTTANSLSTSSTTTPVTVNLLAVNSSGYTTNTTPLLSVTASSSTTVVGGLSGSDGFIFDLSLVSSSRSSEVTAGSYVTVQANQTGAQTGSSGVVALSR